MLSDLLKDQRFNLLAVLLIMQLICTPGVSGLARLAAPYREILSGVINISLGITILALTFVVVKVLFIGGKHI